MRTSWARLEYLPGQPKRIDGPIEIGPKRLERQGAGLARNVEIPIPGERRSLLRQRGVHRRRRPSIWTLHLAAKSRTDGQPRAGRQPPAGDPGRDRRHHLADTVELPVPPSDLLLRMRHARHSVQFCRIVPGLYLAGRLRCGELDARKEALMPVLPPTKFHPRVNRLRIPGRCCISLRASRQLVALMGQVGRMTDHELRDIGLTRQDLWDADALRSAPIRAACSRRAFTSDRARLALGNASRQANRSSRPGPKSRAEA